MESFFFCWHKFSPSRRSEKDQVLFSTANRIGSELEGTSILVPCSKSCSIKRPKMSLYSLGAPDSLGHSKIEFAKQQNKQRFTMKKQRVESFFCWQSMLQRSRTRRIWHHWPFSGKSAHVILVVTDFHMNNKNQWLEDVQQNQQNSSILTDLLPVKKAVRGRASSAILCRIK